MSVPEPTSGVPVWARKRRKPGNPLVGVVLVPLALFGALTAGLAIYGKSFTAAGAQMDGWIATARDRVDEVINPAAKAAPVAPAPPAKTAPAGPPAIPATPIAPEPVPTVGQSGRKGG
jgi:hypothetical protein